MSSTTNPSIRFLARAVHALPRVPHLLKELQQVAQTIGHRHGLLYVGHLIQRLPNVLTSGNLVPVDNAMAGRIWTFNVDGTCVELDGRFFSGAREMYCRKVYFARPGFLIRAGDTVVDLGANSGLFSVLAAKRGARALAVEVQSGYAAVIEENATRNGCRDRVEIETVMVGSGGLLADPDVMLRASHSCGQQPIQVTFASLIAAHNISRIHLLKIDIEGSEFALLTQDSDWLQCVDKIAMEVHTDFGDPIDLVVQLKSRGFLVELVSNDLQVVDKISDTCGYLFAKRLC